MNEWKIDARPNGYRQAFLLENGNGSYPSKLLPLPANYSLAL